MSAQPRYLFVVSDHTGLTAEALSRSLMSQFEGVEVIKKVRPFINSPALIDEVLLEIASAAKNGRRPIVFSTLSNPQLSQRLEQADALIIDAFKGFLHQLSQELEQEPQHSVGNNHGLRRIEDFERYQERIDAIDYSLATDDGLGEIRYQEADIILLGVSRTGKTPTCIYLAMQYGLKAANYPLTEEDFDSTDLPQVLRPHQKRIFGLSINPQRLHEIRQIRRPNSNYASLKQCRFEITWSEALFKRRLIPLVQTTNASVEEIASSLLVQLKNRS